jgi:hypothetical protein
LFFPEVGAKADEAKAICARCLVQRECLEFAMRDPDARRCGIWGGTSARERRKLQAETAAAPKEARAHCEKGHPYTVVRDSDGNVRRRVCRVCRAEYARRLRTTAA